jgi:DNA-directed RNA polymerase specialized sigma24 family protein
MTWKPCSRPAHSAGSPIKSCWRFFLKREDASASNAAFSAFVTRHGPMVLGACRRMFGDEHRAADAYQAVFLILARKAHSVRVHHSL